MSTETSSPGLEVNFLLGSVDRHLLFDTSCDLLEAANLLEPSYRLNANKTVNVHSVEKRLSKLEEFMLSGTLSEWGLAFTSFKLQRAYFELRNASTFPDAHRWVQALVSCGEFVSARLYDWDYEKWQNERDVSAFLRTGREVRGLKLVDDPLAGKRVDISRNPGRSVGGAGFRNALGHQMWFSPLFFSAVGRTPEEVTTLAQEACQEGKYLHVSFSRAPYGTHNPPPEELRRKLFGEHK